MYDIINGSLATSYVAYYQWGNQITNGLVGYGLLTIILAMTFFGTRRYGSTTSHALLLSLVTMSMSTFALVPMGLINQLTMWIIYAATMLMYIYTYHN